MTWRRRWGSPDTSTGVGASSCERAIGIHGAGVGDGVLGHGAEIDRLSIEWQVFVEAGEEQEVVDECGHAAALGLDPRQRGGGAVGVEGSFAERAGSIRGPR